MTSDMNLLPFEILSNPPRYEWHTFQEQIEEQAAFDIRSFLPYKKTATAINQESLRRLLHEARERAWRILDLSNYGLDFLPDAIGELASLEVLILGSEREKSQYFNTFSKLPNAIGNLHNLKALLLNNIPLTQLPPTLVNLKKLKYLDISGNKMFADFPEAVYEFPMLRVLKISYNTTIKKKVKPYIIPDEITQLGELRRLFINGDGFAALPHALGDLPHLEQLRIARTGIQSLPDSVTRSATLREIILFENAVRSLPEQMGEMKALTALRITGEPIEFIPRSMLKLTGLRVFELTKTPLNIKMPPSLQQQSAKAIIHFLLDIQNEEIEKAPPNESKMIIVGQGGVGKTSLLNRLIHDKYEEDPSTLGIDIQEWTIGKTAEETDGEKVLRVWDFGGQEIYHATHQFFLSERSLYVMVWDARQDSDYGRIDYWLNTINLYAKESPVFIVVNKYDGQTPEPKIDINYYKELFPNLQLPLYKISCRENKNIGDLRAHIIKEAERLPLMRQQWLKSWVAVRKHLFELYRLEKKHYILYNEYLEICASNHIDKDEAEILIKCLHDLGFVLCFRHNAELREYVILEKEWGTKAVYEVLNFSGHKNGVVNYSDLNTIWPDENIYPVNMYNVLIELMCQFQLSFKIPQKKQLLMVGLLRFTAVAPVGIFMEEETLCWRCRYDFLPAGLMSRFIVAAHELIMDGASGKQCWYRGAYLEKGEHGRAKIELFDSVGKNYIEIKVWHETKASASQLLNDIRSRLLRINESIPNLASHELLHCNCSPGCTHYFNYKTLCLFHSRDIAHIPCDKTAKLVDINRLITEYNLLTDHRKSAY